MHNSLNNLFTGNKYSITGYRKSHGSFRSKLLSFGFTIGTEFLVIRFTSGGEMFEIELRGERIALHKDTMNVLECTLIKC